MKKLLATLLLLSMSLSLIACGGAVEKEKAEPTKQEEQKPYSKAYFKDNVAEMDDLKIEITESKVIQVGEKGNEFGDKPVIAFWYKTTNKSDKEIDPMSAWLVLFTAIQDNNPNSVNKLEVGMLPDKRFLDSQMEIIKKDGTVENAVAYSLDDNTTPVTLVANQGLLGEEIGRQDFEVK